MTQSNVFKPWNAPEERSTESWAQFGALMMWAGALITGAINYGVRAAEAGDFLGAQFTADDRVDMLVFAVAAIGLLLVATLAMLDRRLTALRRELVAAGIPIAPPDAPATYRTKVGAIEG